MGTNADGDALAGREPASVQPVEPPPPLYKTIEGLITDEEADFLVELARAVPSNGLMVNVGTWSGKSVACCLAGQPDAMLITIDIDHSRIVDSFSGVEYWTEDSGEVALAWDPEKQIDLLFVDGNHSYGGVMRDTVFCRHVKKGGHIAFHDYDAFKHEVTYAVDDWWAEHRGEFRKVACVGYIIVYEHV